MVSPTIKTIKKKIQYKSRCDEILQNCISAAAAASRHVRLKIVINVHVRCDRRAFCMGLRTLHGVLAVCDCRVICIVYSKGLFVIGWMISLVLRNNNWTE